MASDLRPDADSQQPARSGSESLPRAAAGSGGRRTPPPLPSEAARATASSAVAATEAAAAQVVHRVRPVARWLVPLAVVVGIVMLVGWAGRSPLNARGRSIERARDPELADSIDRVDRYFRERWGQAQVGPAEPADDLTVLRRLSQVLHGTIPSLEEIREFEREAPTGRLDRWTDRFIADRRFGDYLAARMARVYVGFEEGQFVVFRRDRYVEWLGDHYRNDTPYDEVVRQMIAARGLWTGEPENNFVTAAATEGEIDENKLAGRTVRAFLGQRIDCAQCHDHPFASWKQGQFQGLAAYFAPTRLSPIGVDDRPDFKYEVEDRKTLEKVVVSPAVPCDDAWLPTDGRQRERLANWVTHPDNRRFDRAIVNRVWGLMFGRPLHDPVDDLPDPMPTSPGSPPDFLDLLAKDFREHGRSLQRLIRVITGSRVFRLESRHPLWDQEATSDQDLVWDHWAAFPLARLRPEQLIGAMVQASNLKTVDQNSHVIIRAVKFFNEIDFVREYGDLGDRELEDRPGTIPQVLLRMNGRFARERTDAGPFGAVGRIAGMGGSAAQQIETAYLVCLTRRPTADEAAFFAEKFTDGSLPPGQSLEDLFWTLFNSPEFGWAH